jgi:carbonic anhydrase
VRVELKRKMAGRLTLALIACLAAPVSAQTPNTVAAAQLQRLQNGNRRYVNGRSRHPNQRPTAGPQYPFAAILSCSDARVAPEILFDQGVNDLFVVRVAGNTVDDPASAQRAVIDSVQLQSLAYAVQSLKVKLIVVLGHDQCGAVKGALQKCGQSSIGPMFQNICPAVNQVVAASNIKPDARLMPTVTGNVREQVKVLKEMAPFKEMVDHNQLRIVGAIYLGNGKVNILAP